MEGAWVSKKVLTSILVISPQNCIYLDFFSTLRAGDVTLAAFTRTELEHAVSHTSSSADADGMGGVGQVLQVTGALGAPKSMRAADARGT